jgi:hypothetical protein
MLLPLVLALAAAAGVPVPTAAELSPQISNPWFPLPVGSVARTAGVIEHDYAAGRTSTLAATRLIAGVRCAVVLDTVALDGRPLERTFDYYAQDAAGNVWYFGEDSFDRQDGRWRRSPGSWRAGVDGARPGIVMEAAPQAGDAYAQEHDLGHAEDQARVLGWVESLTVPYGTFTHVLETEEWTPLEPGVVERKYYASGVGLIRTVMTRGGLELSDLVSLTR